MDISVFIAIGNNGSLILEASPQDRASVMASRAGRA
jgi:hypothetical protein